MDRVGGVEGMRFVRVLVSIRMLIRRWSFELKRLLRLMFFFGSQFHDILEAADPPVLTTLAQYRSFDPRHAYIGLSDPPQASFRFQFSTL